MKSILIILAFLTYYSFTFSQNILGGYLSIQQISQLTYQFTVTTIEVQDTSLHSDFIIFFGDNTNQIIPSIEVIYFPNSIRQNEYIITHTYPGPGDYVISVTGNNWIPNIQNITNSGNEPFQILQLFQINSNVGFNNSAIFTTPCYDVTIVNQQYIYNTGAYDPDGDSLSYSLIPCFVLTYNYPIASNFIGIDSITGDFTWDKPIMSGIYAIGIEIKEWRNGAHINSTIRQMTIIVNPQTSIETSSENDKLIRIYPNITHDLINIESKELKNEKIIIELIKYDGQKMLNIDLKNNSMQIDLSNYSKGIYFIKIKNSNYTRIEKVIKI